MGHSQIRYKFWVSTRLWPRYAWIFSRLLSICRDFKISKNLTKKLTCGCWMIGSEQRCIWPTSNHATHRAHECFWFRHPENSRWFCRILFPNHLKLRYVAMKSTQTHEIHRSTYILLPTSNNTKDPPQPIRPFVSLGYQCLASPLLPFRSPASSIAIQHCHSRWICENIVTSQCFIAQDISKCFIALYVFSYTKKHTLCKRRLCNCQSGDPLIQ